MVPPTKGKLLYHMTHISNAESIFENGLLSRASLIEQHQRFQSIADEEILRERDELNDPLSHYVPFHFMARNPFDYGVCHDHGSDNMMIITVRRDRFKNDAKVIPEHPLSGCKPDIYPYEEGIQRIRWDILDDLDNRDYKDHDIKMACMAECLIDDRVDVSDFFKIYVNSQSTMKRIEPFWYRCKGLIASIDERMFPPNSGNSGGLHFLP